MKYTDWPNIRYPVESLTGFPDIYLDTLSDRAPYPSWPDIRYLTKRRAGQIFSIQFVTALDSIKCLTQIK